MTVTGMLIYSVLIILHYYFIIIFYYHIIQLLLLQIWVNISHNSKNIEKKTQFSQKTSIAFWGTLFFAGKKAPAGAGRPSKRGWSYPITFRSLVVKHPAPTQNVDRNFYMFLTYFGVVWEHLGCIQGVVRGR